MKPMSELFDEQDELMMSLVHYFITKENYSPMVVQGIGDEAWLENIDGPYRVIRISFNYIHNKEQFESDVIKVRNVLRQIKKQTLSLNVRTLNIYLNMNDGVECKYFNKIDSIKTSSIDNVKNNPIIVNAFPKMKDSIFKNNKIIDFMISAGSEINRKTAKDSESFENIFKKKKIIVTKIFIAICALMFIATYIFGKGPLDTYTLLLFGANYGPLVKNGEVWRLLSCSFLHAGFIHLFVNMYSLYQIGFQAENFFGKLKYVIIYLISAVSASMLSALFGSSLSVGASGAIFGLLGALLYFGYHYRLYLKDVLKRQLIPIIILNLSLGFMLSGIDNAGHIGGLIGGVLSSMALGVGDKTSKIEKRNGIICLSIYFMFLIYLLFFR